MTVTIPRPQALRRAQAPPSPKVLSKAPGTAPSSLRSSRLCGRVRHAPFIADYQTNPTIPHPASKTPLRPHKTSRDNKQTQPNPRPCPHPDPTRSDQIRQKSSFAFSILTPSPEPSKHLQLIPLKTELRLWLVDRHLVMPAPARRARILVRELEGAEQPLQR